MLCVRKHVFFSFLKKKKKKKQFLIKLIRRKYIFGPYILGNFLI